MANDNNTDTDWVPGQPPPWLADYGPVPPAVDDSLAGAPGAPGAIPVAGPGATQQSSAAPPLPDADPMAFDPEGRLARRTTWALEQERNELAAARGARPMQPGLGVPASAVDAAAQQLANPAAPPPTSGGASRLGAPGFGPIPESAIPKPQQFAQPPLFQPGPAMPPLQPGLGVPASAIDNAASAVQQAPQHPPWLQNFSDTIGGVANDATQTLSKTIGAVPQGLTKIQGEAWDRSTAIALDPKASESDRMAAWQRLPADRRTNIVHTADSELLASVATPAWTDEERGTTGIRFQADQQHKQSLQELDLMKQDAEQAERNRQMRQAIERQTNQATAQVVADAKALSQQKIDPNEHGVGHFIASVLLSAIGGAMSQYTGGRNLALEELDKKTQARIDAQKADIANQWQGVNFKRNLLDEQYQRGIDQYRAEETYRIQTYDRAKSELLTKMQDYVAGGTTALRIADYVQQVDARRAEAIRQLWQQGFKNDLEAAKVDLDKRKAEQEAKFKEREAGDREWAIASENKRAANSLDEQRLAREEAIAARLQARDDAKAEKAETGTIGGVPQGIDADGNVAYGKITNADGKPLVIPDKEQHAKLTKMIGAADEVNRLSNQLAREIKEWGGQSDTVKGPKWQKIKSDREALIFALHAAEGIEGFRPGTAEMLEKLTGDVDPTAYLRTATPGIIRARDNVNAMVDTQLRRQAGYTGKAYAPADTSTTPTPTTTEIGEAGKDIAGSTKGIQAEPKLDMRDPDDQVYQQIQNVGGIKGTWADRHLRGEDENDQIEGFRKMYGDRFTPVVEHALRTGLAPSQMKRFDFLENTLTSRDPKVTDEMKREAAAQLGELATNAPTQAIGDYAAQLLTKTSISGIRPVSGSEEPDTSTAHESAPGGR